VYIESDDEIYRTLFLYSRTTPDGEGVTLPELKPGKWLRVNNCLVSRGAVRRGESYYFHPGACAALILAVRFEPKRKSRPRKSVKYQRSLFQEIYGRIAGMPTITVVGVRVGQPARAEEIGDDLKSFQAFVGGNMELHGIGADIAVVCNEDGVDLRLPENGCGMLGPWFFTKNDDGGNQVSLSEAEVTACLAYWATYRQMKHGGVARTEVHSFDSFEEMEEFRERRKREAKEAN
jgi:hypothetical protein